MSVTQIEMDQITEKIIGCSFNVGNKLGVGFLEKVYENALVYELRKAGLKVQPQVPIQVKYENVIVGDFTYDLLVEDNVVVELKSVQSLNSAHVA